MARVIATRPPSLAMRQAVLIMLLSTVAILLCGVVLIEQTRSAFRDNALTTIDADMAGLVDVMAAGGVPELQKRISDRIALHPDGGEAPLYYLVGPDGARLGGNMAGMPDLDPATSAAGDVAVGEDRAVARATRLRGGVTLVVGRSLAALDRVEARLWRIFVWTALAVAGGALVIGRLAAEGMRRRVKALNAAFERFDDGDTNARVGETGGGDELSRLGVHVDTHLARIEQLIASQRQISDNIAHELRTPLVHLDDRLLRGLALSPPIAVAAEIDAARAEIRMVVSLFDKLLDIATAEASAPTTLADLSEVAADVVELYAASAEESSIDLVARIAPGVTLRGEAMQLARMIANLLDNALKYAPPGSRVRIEVAPGPKLIVEDNGPGIPPEDRERVFQRFLRSGTRANGHGLGLALVRVIAMRHGLTARVEDARPGARFVIEPAV